MFLFVYVPLFNTLLSVELIATILRASKAIKNIVMMMQWRLVDRFSPSLCSRFFCAYVYFVDVIVYSGGGDASFGTASSIVSSCCFRTSCPSDF